MSDEKKDNEIEKNSNISSDTHSLQSEYEYNKIILIDNKKEKDKYLEYLDIPFDYKKYNEINIKSHINSDNEENEEFYNSNNYEINLTELII